MRSDRIIFLSPASVFHSITCCDAPFIVQKKKYNTIMKKNHQTAQRIKKIDLVKNWLLRGKKLTSRQCSRMWGYDRLADGIWKLRAKGMNIHTELKQGEDRFNNTVEYAVYYWLGEKPEIKRTNKNVNGNRYSFVHHFPMTAAKMKKHAQEFLKKEKVYSWKYKKKHSTLTGWVGTTYRVFDIRQTK